MSDEGGGESPSPISVLIEALEIIAGERQCLDNLMGDRDIATQALKIWRQQ